MFTKIDLCSMALIKLGEKPIQSLNEDSASAQLARTLYDPIVDTLLSTFPWRFATKPFVLNKNSDGKIVIPVDVLRIIKCDGQIVGNTIETPADTIDVIAIVKTAPEYFPEYFSTLTATKLAMEFCIPLIGDKSIFQMMTALFESEYQTAKFLDSATSNISNIDKFSLIDSRF